MISCELSKIQDDVAVSSIDAAARSEWHGYSDITVAIEAVAICGMKSLIDVISKDRFLSAQRLLVSYEDSRVDPYDSVIMDEDSAQKVLLPPVIERSEHGLLIIDGVHRLLATHVKGYSHVRAAVISTNESLPPYVINEISLTDVRQSEEIREPILVNKYATNPLFRPGGRIVQSAVRIVTESYINK